jgi:hypothetical protein
MNDRTNREPAEVLAASIDMFMRAMNSDFVGERWDGYTITFTARRCNEITEIHGLTMKRGPIK